MRETSLPVRDAARAVAALLCATVMASAPLPAQATVALVKEVGAEFVKEARAQLPFIHDHEIKRFVDTIGKRFVSVLGTQPFEYEFFVLAEDSINAFAVPGGKIVVHAGLISRAESVDELADVIGHEVAHAHAHHSVRQQQKGTAATYASLLGIFLTAVNPVLGQAAIAAAMSQQLKYQRDFEREADFLGIEYARKAGYDPSAMLSLLRKIYEEQQINPTAIPPYFLSHPLSGERMAYLEAALGTSEWEGARLTRSWELERAQAIVRAYSQTRREAVPPYERRLAQASPADKPAALELIGILMVHGDDYELGRKYLEQAEAAGRKVDRELGRAYLRQGALDKAETRLKRAVAVDAEDYDAMADLGEIYHQRGDYAAAVTEMERSVALYPFSPSVQRALGRALDKAGRTAAGYYHLAKAAELEGQALTALDYYQRANGALKADDPLKKPTEEKIAELEKLRPRIPMPPRPGGRLSQ